MSSSSSSTTGSKARDQRNLVKAGEDQAKRHKHFKKTVAGKPMTRALVKRMGRKAGIHSIQRAAADDIIQFSDDFIGELAQTLAALVESNRRKTVYLRHVRAAADHHGVKIYGL